MSITESEYQEIVDAIRESSFPVGRKNELIAALAQIKVQREELLNSLTDKEILPIPKYKGCLSWKFHPGCGEACYGICSAEGRQLCKDQFDARIGLKEKGHDNT